MRKILFALLMVLFIPLNVNAADVKDEVINDNGKIQYIYDYISNMKNQFEMLNDLDPKTYVDSFLRSGKGSVSTEKLYKALVNFVFKELLASVKIMTLIIIIAIVAALINNLQSAFSNETLSNIAYFACYGLLIIIVTKSFYIGVDLVKETIVKMSDFMAALMPVLMMLLVSVGGITQAAVMDPIIIGAINIGARLYVTIIIPVIFMGFILQFVNNISEDYKIDKMTKLINQSVIWTQGIIMTIFIGILTVRGITSQTIDHVTAKTAKYAVDNFIPVVGKCLSDAISTVAGYSLLLKNALSGLGLIIIIVLVIFPIIKVLIMAMLYKFTAALIEPVSDKRLVNCISSAGDSLTLVMSCLISVSVMFFVMISIIATMGKAVMGG